MKLNEEARQVLRSLTRGAYDIQKLRIQIGNRLCAAFRSRLGLKAQEGEKKDKDAKKILDRLRAEYKKITDGVKKELPTIKAFKPIGIIHSYTELCLISEYLQLEALEAKHLAKGGRLDVILGEYDLYTKYLTRIRGCGPAMSAVIMSEFNIHKAEYASQMIRYSGFSVEADGKGTSKRAEHLYDIQYTDRDGKVKTRKGIRHNPWLKTKLYVLGGCLVKMGFYVDKSNGARIPMTKYGETYLNYLNRLNNHQVYGEAQDAVRIKEVQTATGKKYSPKAHRRAMALRYVIKAFIMDLYEAWRKLEGLPVNDLYHTAKLGLRHHSNFADQFEYRPAPKGTLVVKEGGIPEPEVDFDGIEDDLEFEEAAGETLDVAIKNPEEEKPEEIK